MEVTYQSKQWFEEQFIYQGKSMNELCTELGMDWTSVDRWREIHSIPRHSNKDAIITTYGQAVYDNIKKRKSDRYKKSNARKREQLKGKTLEEIHGEEKAQEIKKKMSKANKGRVISEEVRRKASERQKGENNTNWKGGVYSSTTYLEVDRIYVYEHVGQTWNRYIVIEKDYTCERCGTVSLDCNGHHKLPFSRIFEGACKQAESEGDATTMNVLLKMHRFHKAYHREIYECLCSECHRQEHRQESLLHRIKEEKNLEHLLDYFKPKEVV